MDMITSTISNAGKDKVRAGEFKQANRDLRGGLQKRGPHGPSRRECREVHIATNWGGLQNGGGGEA